MVPVKVRIEEKLVSLRHNHVVRTAMKPIFEIYDHYLYSAYKNTEDVRKLASLKNIHKGKRCFVIGNGPSLLPSDLDKLRYEVTFGANRIYNIFDQTMWRPTYYISLDPASVIIELSDIKAGGDYIKFLNYRANRQGRNDEDHIIYLFPKGKYQIDPFAEKVTCLSEDISKFVSKVNTVTVNSIEIAIYMGFTEIYLLGVDNNYATKVGKNGKIYTDPAIKSSYFKGMKDTGGREGDGGLSFQNVDSMNYSYELARKLADSKGVKICNATRGGKLDIFDRVNYDNLF